MSTSKTKSRLLKEHDVAQRLSLSVSTIRRMRLTGEGPEWFKINGSVRYCEDELDDYLGSLPRHGGRK